MKIILMILIVSLTILSISSFFEDAETICLTTVIIISCISCLYINNLFVVYLIIELQTFCILIILGSSSNDPQGKTVEATLKYLVLSGIVSTFFLLGIYFSYFDQLCFFINNYSITSSWYTKLSLLLIFLSLSFKFGFVPFHFWLLDIYEGCSWKILAIVVSIPKITYLFIIFRLDILDYTIIALGLLSLTIGTLGAFNQIKIKRLLGYSSISQSGFLILCLLLPKNIGFTLGFIFFIIYIISFLTLIHFLDIANLSKNIFESGKIVFFNKFLSLLLVINIFSIAGFPPLAGFISKWYVILYLIQYNYTYVAYALIIFSILSMAYYLYLIKLIFFEKNKNFYIWNQINNTINLTYDKNTFKVLPYFLLFFISALWINPDIMFFLW